MDKRKVKKYLYIILPAIIIFAIYGISYYLINTDRFLITPEQTGVRIAPISFDSEIDKFQPVFKKAFIATAHEEKIASLDSLNKAIKNWREIDSYYRENQPDAYYKTVNWADKINLLFELLVKSENAAREDKFIEAHDHLLMFAKMLRDMRRENDKKVIADDMISFYDSLIPVVTAVDKEGTVTPLNGLKLNFTTLKEYNLNSSYKEQISTLEKVIGDIDKLYGPDFFSAKDKLEPAFEKLYLDFG